MTKLYGYDFPVTTRTHYSHTSGIRIRNNVNDRCQWTGFEFHFRFFRAAICRRGTIPFLVHVHVQRYLGYETGIFGERGDKKLKRVRETGVSIKQPFKRRILVITGCNRYAFGEKIHCTWHLGTMVILARYKTFTRIQPGPFIRSRKGMRAWHSRGMTSRRYWFVYRGSVYARYATVGNF